MKQPATPRLCIGLPVYNGEAYLAGAIASLLDQTFADFRLIISDNASSDDTEVICRDFAQRDARVDYHRSAVNRGLAWNFNRVVALADAPYFKWAADDDLYAPAFVARCIAALEEDAGVILAYSNGYKIDADGTMVGVHREPADASSTVPWVRFRDLVWNRGACTMMFGVCRLEVLRQTQLIGAYPASDTVMLAELALRGRWRVIDEPLFFWRDHPDRPIRACSSDAELAVCYAPENAGHMQFRHLTLFANYLRAIARVPLSPGQRLRCTAVMMQWFLRMLPTIQDEVRGNIARPLRRALARWLPISPSDSESRA